jgi:hypothetical protein
MRLINYLKFIFQDLSLSEIRYRYNCYIYEQEHHEGNPDDWWIGGEPTNLETTDFDGDTSDSVFIVRNVK